MLIRIAILIVVSALLFAVGTTIERHDHHQERAGEVVHSEGDVDADAHATTREDTKVAGIDVESPALIAAAVAASLALAAAALRGRLLAAVAAALLLFAALDVREVVHQADEARTGLTILAASVAVMHLAAAGLAVRATRSATRSRPGSAPARS